MRFQYFSSIPMSSLFPTSSSDIQFLLHPPSTPSIPLPLRPGDFDIDGFPDLLLTVTNSSISTSSGGIFGSSRGQGTQVRILENVPCKKGIAGCDARGRGRRGLRVGSGKGWQVLNEIRDVEGASWIDIDDDASSSTIFLPESWLTVHIGLARYPRSSIRRAVRSEGHFHPE